MSNETMFLNDLAELMSKHKVAICARQKGEYAEMFFQFTQPAGRTAEINTGRTHSSGYEIELIANETSEFNEAELAMYGMTLDPIG